jgi:hypothetical protein
LDPNLLGGGGWANPDKALFYRGLLQKTPHPGKKAKSAFEPRILGPNAILGANLPVDHLVAEMAQI